MYYMKLTAIVKKGEKQYVALCPEVDVASQGHTVEEAIENLKEAVELFIEVEGPSSLSNEELIITSIEVKDEETPKIVR
jgi:predicted RNase H-like HicB family nuclease